MIKSFTAQYRVYYEDTDAGAVVYYANYLKFFERARTDFLRHLGISQQQIMLDDKLVFVVKRCEIDYLKGAKLDDLLDVSVMVEKIGAASLIMKQIMLNGDQIMAQLQVEIVVVDSQNFKPKKLPMLIKQALLDYIDA